MKFKKIFLALALVVALNTTSVAFADTITIESSQSSVLTITPNGPFDPPPGDAM